MPPVERMNEIPETTPVRALVGARRAAVFDFELYPHLWERRGYARVMKKVKWASVFFVPENSDRVPSEPGIYMFVVAPRHAYVRDHTYIFYIGQAVDLNQRYENYLKEELGEELEKDRERIVDFLNHCRGHIYFNYFLCPEPELTTREDYLVDHIYPWANTRHRKDAKGRLARPQEAAG